MFNSLESLGGVINDSDEMTGIKGYSGDETYTFRNEFRLVVEPFAEPFLMEGYRYDKVDRGEPVGILRDEVAGGILRENECGTGPVVIFESMNDVIERAARSIVAESGSLANYGHVGKESKDLIVRTEGMLCKGQCLKAMPAYLSFFGNEHFATAGAERRVEEV